MRIWECTKISKEVIWCKFGSSTEEHGDVLAQWLRCITDREGCEFKPQVHQSAPEQGPEPSNAQLDKNVNCSG